MCTEKLVKSSTLAVVPGCLVALLFLKPLIKEAAALLLMSLYFSMTVGNRSPLVDRIVALQAIPSCRFVQELSIQIQLTPVDHVVPSQAILSCTESAAC